MKEESLPGSIWEPCSWLFASTPSPLEEVRWLCWQTALHSDQLFSLSNLVTATFLSHYSASTTSVLFPILFTFLILKKDRKEIQLCFRGISPPQCWGNGGGTRCMWVALFKPWGTRLSNGIAALSQQFHFLHPISVCLWCFAGRAWDVCFCVAFVSQNRWGCYFRDWRKCSFLYWRTGPGKHQLNSTLFQAITPSSHCAWLEEKILNLLLIASSSAVSISLKFSLQTIATNSPQQFKGHKWNAWLQHI